MDNTETCAEITVRRLLEIFTCCNCLEAVSQIPVQCVNEHFLCRECQGELTVCPTCREPFSDEMPFRLISQIIDMLPKVCKHNNCGMFFQPGDEHVKFCGYQETMCLACSWIGPNKDLLPHLTQCNSTSIFSSCTQILKISDFFPANKVSVVLYFNVNKYLFSIVANNLPAIKKFYISCNLIPNGKPKDEIFFKVSFTSAKSEAICKIKINPYPFNFEHYHHDPYQGTLEKNCIYIPWYSLQDYIGSDQGLSFEVYFTFEKIERQEALQ